MDDDQKETLLFRIDDGETHWVAATGYEEAVKLYAKSMCDSFDQYIDECCDGEYPECVVETADKITVDVTNLAPKSITDSFPRGCGVQVVIPRRRYADLSHGVVATTVY